MQQLEHLDALVIKQKKEWGEILTGFETRNNYSVMGPDGRELYYAGEDSSFLSRMFLKTMRPFTIDVVGTDGTPVIQIRRPFRFFFPEVSVFDTDGLIIGTIKKRFSFARRIYSVLDSNGQEAFELFGPMLHPWTFEIRERGMEIGKITKKWSGLGKEIFTDADNFGVTFPETWDIRTKALFLGAVFLIDFVHFEKSNNN